MHSPLSVVYLLHPGREGEDFDLNLVHLSGLESNLPWWRYKGCVPFEARGWTVLVFHTIGNGSCVVQRSRVFSRSILDTGGQCVNSMNGHFERGGPAFPAFEVMLVIKLISRMINRGREGG